MVFNSLQFLVFFMVVTILFYRIKNQRGRIWLLLLSSCYFYMTFVPIYILILGFTIVIDYIAGILIASSDTQRKRKAWLWLSVISNVGILGFYKYFNFILGNFEPLIANFFPHHQVPYLNIILPIGLSFHTFQAMSYTIEVYRGNQKPEKNFIVYALYVMFYPQVVAGPLERPQNILPQIKEYRPYNWDNIKEGLARMLWGFFKKVVIADRVAMIVDHTFTHTNQSSSRALFIGAFIYYFQIYCDFSGYSDIALGAAKVMNIKLMENFNQPIFSKNISDFWRRWHISLYSWFYDYIFNPIVITLRDYQHFAMIFSMLFVFSLSGLWHGAAWHHILYGLIHGVALVFEYLTRKKRKAVFSKLPQWINNSVGIFITFSFVVFSRIFFRAETVPEAWNYLRAIFTFRGGSNNIGMNLAELMFSIFVIVIMVFRERLFPEHLIKSDKRFYLYTFAMIAICYWFGVFGENQFIYFQF